ncbi:MAG: glycosyltransferase family 4 protein [Deltaproteobacteria bacterium]|nr:glycosyltransferase family 4 protein [Deltaproteobacteria bacterium]
MKILMPFWSGDERSVERLLDRYLPQMVAISGCVDEFHIVYFGEKIKRSEIRKHFVLHHVELPRLAKVLPAIMFRVLIPPSLYQAVRNLKPDIIYALNGIYQESAWYFSMKMKIPYVVRLRGDFQEIEKARYDQLGRRRSLRISPMVRDFLQIKTFKSANMVVPISEGLRRKAVKWGIPKECLHNPIYNGVDIKTFKPINSKREDRHDLILGYGGRISHEKRIDKLIEILEAFPNVLLILAGVWFIPKTELPKNIKYIGHMRHQDMPNFYSMIDVSILPSVTEGFPNMILESYACEVPVLCSNEAFPFEDLKLFGKVSELDNFDCEIEKLISNREMIRDLGEQARKYVSNIFSWKDFGRKMTDVFSTAITTYAGRRVGGYLLF